MADLWDINFRAECLKRELKAVKEMEKTMQQTWKRLIRTETTLELTIADLEKFLDEQGED